MIPLLLTNELCGLIAGSFCFGDPSVDYLHGVHVNDRDTGADARAVRLAVAVHRSANL